MKANWKKRIGSFLLAAFVLVIGATPVFADTQEPIQLVFEDVTATDPTILSGEAKLKVSLAEPADNIYGFQIALNFIGDLQYKSVQYLIGSNNPPASVQVSQNTADVNRDLVVSPTVLSQTAFDFSESTDLFIITFYGDPAEDIQVSLDDSAEKSYITTDKLVGGNYVPVTAEEDTIELKSSIKSGESMDAAILITMDKLADIGFKSSFGDNEPYYRDPGVSIRITGEENSTDILMFLDDMHRDTNASVPTFKVKTPLLANSTYTVKITGMGFAPCELIGVDFTTLLVIDNELFVPGDVNGDERVDGIDKALFKQIQEAGEYNEAADFNRDGKVNNNDFTILSHLPDVDIDSENPNPPPVEEEEKTVPKRMEKPEVTGGNKSITVEWEKLKEDKDEKYPVTGYIIKYGKSKSNMDETEEIDDPDETSFTITGLSKDTTYYVCIAAVNANGTGTFSTVVSNTTDGASTDGGGGGGGGGGTVRPSTPSTPSTPTTPTTPTTPVNPDEPFTDLGNYEWAKESIYTLKDEGIISGTSETTFSPANNIKRGDFILILVRMLGIEGEVTENFADVPADSYYYQAIGIAKAAGIAKGSGDNFMPEETITRQDLITLAYRAFLEAGAIAETDDLSVLDQFGDKAEISEYAQAPMASMVSAGVIKGSDGNVNPLGNATRAETAVMCARLFNMMK